jgi:hypothetical protein
VNGFVVIGAVGLAVALAGGHPLTHR